jgi:hypothetical protein
MAECRYKDYSLELLFAEKQGTEDALAQLKRDIADFEREVRRRHSNSPIPISRYLEDEDYVGMRRHAESLSKELSEINAELFIRGQQSPGAPESRGASSKFVAVSCNCRPPRRFTVAGRAYDRGPIICGNCNQPFRLV